MPFPSLIGIVVDDGQQSLIVYFDREEELIPHARCSSSGSKGF